MSSVLTNTLSRFVGPAVVKLADTGGGSPSLVAPVTVTHTLRSVVIPIGGAGDVAMQRRFEDWTPPHWGEIPEIYRL